MHGHGKKMSALGTSHARTRHSTHMHMCLKKFVPFGRKNVTITCPKTRRKKGFLVGALNAHLMSSSSPFLLKRKKPIALVFLFFVCFVSLFFFSTNQSTIPHALTNILYKTNCLKRGQSNFFSSHNHFYIVTLKPKENIHLFSQHDLFVLVCYTFNLELFRHLSLRNY